MNDFDTIDKSHPDFQKIRMLTVEISALLAHKKVSQGDALIALLEVLSVTAVISGIGKKDFLKNVERVFIKNEVKVNAIQNG